MTALFSCWVNLHSQVLESVNHANNVLYFNMFFVVAFFL